MSILQNNFRSSDFVARYGGEEFVVVLPNTDSESAYLAAEHCRKAIEASDWIDNSIVTASFGVASNEKRARSAEQLIIAADQVLYRAKSAGRNRVVIDESAELKAA